jgi:NAD(P)-dependent dehydrogenase (short-subunit alcohol dehydrogenase family)
MPVAVVTGGTDGIGRKVAHVLAAGRHEVIVVGRKIGPSTSASSIVRGVGA